MGRSKRTGPTPGAAAAPVPDIDAVICYFCEKEFKDERILVQHQLSKHFSCTECKSGKSGKCNNLHGLIIHYRKVHIAELKAIPNALEGRNEPSACMEIFGTRNVPEEVLSDWRSRGYGSINDRIDRLNDSGADAPSLPVAEASTVAAPLPPSLDISSIAPGILPSAPLPDLTALPPLPGGLPPLPGGLPPLPPGPRLGAPLPQEEKSQGGDWSQQVAQWLASQKPPEEEIAEQPPPPPEEEPMQHAVEDSSSAQPHSFTAPSFTPPSFTPPPTENNRRHGFTDTQEQFPSKQVDPAAATTIVAAVEAAKLSFFSSMKALEATVRPPVNFPHTGPNATGPSMQMASPSMQPPPAMQASSMQPPPTMQTPSAQMQPPPSNQAQGRNSPGRGRGRSRSPPNMTTADKTILITGGVVGSRLWLKKEMERFGRVEVCHTGNRQNPIHEPPWVRFEKLSSAETALNAINNGQVLLDGMTIKAEYKKSGRSQQSLHPERNPPSRRDLEVTSRDLATEGGRDRRDSGGGGGGGGSGYSGGYRGGYSGSYGADRNDRGNDRGRDRNDAGGGRIQWASSRDLVMEDRGRDRDRRRHDSRSPRRRR